MVGEVVSQEGVMVVEVSQEERMVVEVSLEVGEVAQEVGEEVYILKIKKLF